jgi:hypothetical protein
MTTINHNSRVGRPAIGVLENPLEHGVVRPLDDDQTPRLFHAATIGAEVGNLPKEGAASYTPPTIAVVVMESKGWARPSSRGGCV